MNSIRAVLSSSNVTGINNDANVVLWGYSGGSQPASWGAFLHPEYAPEINLVGSAFGGIIADIDSIARYNLGKLTAGFVFAAINGLAQEYSQLAEFLKEKVYSSQYAKFTLPKSTCLIEYVPAFIFLTLEDFSSGGIGLLDDPIVKNITDLNNSINKNFKPTAPLFMYNSIADEIVPAGDADKLYDNLCSNGATIQYRQDILGEHGIQAVTGAPMAFEFLKDRLDGVPIARGCSKQLNLSNALTPQGLKGLPVIIVTALLTLIGVPVGVYSWLI